MRGDDEGEALLALDDLLERWRIRDARYAGSERRGRPSAELDMIVSARRDEAMRLPAAVRDRALAELERMRAARGVAAVYRRVG